MVICFADYFLLKSILACCIIRRPKMGLEASFKLIFLTNNFGQGQGIFLVFDQKPGRFLVSRHLSLLAGT